MTITTADHTVRIRPAVLTAGLSAIVVALLVKGVQVALQLHDVQSAASIPGLQSPLIWPFLSRVRIGGVATFALQLVLLGLVAALVSWFGIRAVSITRGFGGVLIVVWFATILAGYATAPVVVPLYYGNVRPVGQFVLIAAGGGGGWGLWTGWIGGLVAALVFSAGQRRPTARSAATSYPGS